MATGALDANGVWIYGEDDPASPVSDLLNLGMDSTSDAVGDAKARLTTLEGLGVWTAYTPTVTAATTNPNIGTTGTRVGSYVRIGKTVLWRAIITAGGTGVAAGSGAYSVSLPPAAPTGLQIEGHGWMYASAGFKACVVDGPAGRLVRTDTGALIDNTVGFAAAGHTLSVGGSYEAA